jgi:hypothetical protein
VLPTSYRQVAAAALLCAALGGCNAAGEPGGDKTFSDKRVPFTFAIPADFTKAPIDNGDSRGDVLAAAGISKLDLIAVRRVDGARLPSGPVTHEVQGRTVTSELHPVDGTGYVIECQYQPAEAEKVRSACRTALATIRRG